MVSLPISKFLSEQRLPVHVERESLETGHFPDGSDQLAGPNVGEVIAGDPEHQLLDALVVHNQIDDALQRVVFEVVVSEVDLEGVGDRLDLADGVIELLQLVVVARERAVLVRVDVEQKPLVVLRLYLRDVVGQVLKLEYAQFFVVHFSRLRHAANNVNLKYPSNLIIEATVGFLHMASFVENAIRQSAPRDNKRITGTPNISR